MSHATRRYDTIAEVKDRTTGVIRIRKLGASNLPNLEFIGRTDPFVEISYLGL